MLPHHIKLDVCEDRPKYRQGRKLTSVKVYSVSDESKYLLILGVPVIDVAKELHATCSAHGTVTAVSVVEDYPSEAFTKTYLLKYENINSARVAKRKLDGLEFYGGQLHVCYAPEYETVDETRWKLQERRITVARKCRQLEEEKLGKNPTGHLQKSHSSSTSLTSNAIGHSSSIVTQQQSRPSYEEPRLSHYIPSTADSIMQNPYLYSVPGDLVYPSMLDSAERYSYQTEVSEMSELCAEVQPVSILGLENVTADNLNLVEVRRSSETSGQHDSTSSLPTSSDTSSKAGHKRQHSAAAAASWHSASFSGAPTKVIKLSDAAPAIESPQLKEHLVASSVGSHQTSGNVQQSSETVTRQYQPVSDKIIIRAAQPMKGSSKPKFVPRQLAATMTAAALAGHSTVVANSAILGKEQGARLPPDVEREIRANSGQHVADQTTLDIREKINRALS